MDPASTVRTGVANRRASGIRKERLEERKRVKNCPMPDGSQTKAPRSIVAGYRQNQIKGAMTNRPYWQIAGVQIQGICDSETRTGVS